MIYDIHPDLEKKKLKFRKKTMINHAGGESACWNMCDRKISQRTKWNFMAISIATTSFNSYIKLTEGSNWIFIPPEMVWWSDDRSLQSRCHSVAKRSFSSQGRLLTLINANHSHLVMDNWRSVRDNLHIYQLDVKWCQGNSQNGSWLQWSMFNPVATTCVFFEDTGGTGFWVWQVEKMDDTGTVESKMYRKAQQTVVVS